VQTKHERDHKTFLPTGEKKDLGFPTTKSAFSFLAGPSKRVPSLKPADRPAAQRDPRCDCVRGDDDSPSSFFFPPSPRLANHSSYSLPPPSMLPFWLIGCVDWLPWVWRVYCDLLLWLALVISRAILKKSLSYIQGWSIDHVSERGLSVLYWYQLAQISLELGLLLTSKLLIILPRSSYLVRSASYLFIYLAYYFWTSKEIGCNLYSNKAGWNLIWCFWCSFNLFLDDKVPKFSVQYLHIECPSNSAQSSMSVYSI
jgi:hypothetical protein